MTDFHYYLPLDVRYSDLDPQWHANNARIVSYLEQGRISYLMHLGLFDGKSFFNIGLIVADVHVVYIAPIFMAQRIRVGVKVSHIGNKSLKFEYVIEDMEIASTLVKAETVMVAYDYNNHTSVTVWPEWRTRIDEFEGTHFATP